MTIATASLPMHCIHNKLWTKACEAWPHRTNNTGLLNLWGHDLYVGNKMGDCKLLPLRLIQTWIPNRGVDGWLESQTYQDLKGRQQEANLCLSKTVWILPNTTDTKPHTIHITPSRKQSWKIWQCQGGDRLCKILGKQLLSGVKKVSGRRSDRDLRGITRTIHPYHNIQEIYVGCRQHLEMWWMRSHWPH